MVEKVYFIQAPSGLIKIGRSTDVTRRKKALQLAHGERLKLLGAVPGGAILEREFHDRWASLRQTGEWFKPAPDLLADIKRTLDAPQFDLASKPRLNARTGADRERIAQNLIDYFKQRHPTNTATEVALDTGIPVDTVRKWMERASAPSVMYFEPLMLAYGPTFMAAVWPVAELPEWLREAIAIEQAEMLMDRIRSDMTALDAALGSTRRGDIAAPIAEYARSRSELETTTPPKPTPGDQPHE